MYEKSRHPPDAVTGSLRLNKQQPAKPVFVASVVQVRSVAEYESSDCANMFLVSMVRMWLFEKVPSRWVGLGGTGGRGWN